MESFRDDKERDLSYEEFLTGLGDLRPGGLPAKPEQVSLKKVDSAESLFMNALGDEGYRVGPVLHHPVPDADEVKVRGNDDQRVRALYGGLAELWENLMR